MSLPILSVDDFMIGNVRVEHECSTLSSSAVNWHETTLSRGLHRIIVDFDIMLANDADVKKYESFYLRCNGRANPFQLDTGTDTSWSNPFVTATIGKHSLASPVTIGTSKINITGNLSGVENGCKLQIGASTKIYTVISRNLQQLEIYPAVRFAFPASTAITFAVKPILRLKDDVSGKIGYGSRANTISITAVEVMQ